MFKQIVMVLAAALFTTIGAGAHTANAATKEYLDYEVQSSIQQFITKTDGGKGILDKATGILVFPRILKAGAGVGAEFGEGALFLKGNPVPDSYYNILSLSFGWQLGAQVKSVIFVFLNDKALADFRGGATGGWKVGVDGSVAVLSAGVGTSLDTDQLTNPVVVIVFDQRGLMYNLTFEGSKITRIEK